MRYDILRETLGKSDAVQFWVDSYIYKVGVNAKKRLPTIFLAYLLYLLLIRVALPDAH